MKRLRVTVIAGFVVPLLLVMLATLVGGAGQIVRIGRIFEKFCRARASERQGRHGSSVGLALARHVVDAHEGDVQVESRPGEGRRFHHPAAAAARGET